MAEIVTVAPPVVGVLIVADAGAVGWAVWTMVPLFVVVFRGVCANGRVGAEKGFFIVRDDFQSGVRESVGPFGDCLVHSGLEVGLGSSVGKAVTHCLSGVYWGPGAEGALRYFVGERLNAKPSFVMVNWVCSSIYWLKEE